MHLAEEQAIRISDNPNLTAVSLSILNNTSRLTITRCRSTEWPAIADCIFQLPLLSELVVTECMLPTSFIEHFKTCNLLKLDLSNNDLEDRISVRLPLLLSAKRAELHLQEGNPKLTCKAFNRIIAECAHLTLLELPVEMAEYDVGWVLPVMTQRKKKCFEFVIGNVTGLNALNMNNLDIGDEEMEALTDRYHGLRKLEISNSRIGSQGVEFIALRLSTLLVLNLESNRLSNQCCRSLRELLLLDRLNIVGNLLSEEGQATLAARHPWLEVLLMQNTHGRCLLTHYLKSQQPKLLVNNLLSRKGDWNVRNLLSGIPTNRLLLGILKLRSLMRILREARYL